MIAKGNLHGHGVKLAAYLTTSSAEERAELVELRGFMATSIRDAFIDVMIQAEGTRAEKPFFHAYVRAPEGEQLARETWLTFADRLEKRLGFAGQPRALAFHHGLNSGETHLHLAWSRIDLETMRAIDPGLYKAKMKQLCREFEREYGLTLVPNERQADQKTRAAERGEFEQARRLKTDLKAIRNAIHDAWQKADNGQAFAAALDEAGLILARGDRRDFVVIDRAGGDHALSKRITGATASETRQRLADIDRASLPSVADAKAMQRARSAEDMRGPQPVARKDRAMNETEPSGPSLSEAAAVRQRERLVQDAARLQEAERVQAEMHSAQRYREQLERDGEDARKATKEKQEKDAERAAAGDIADAHNRYAQALGAVYVVRDPYGSLANAAMVEYGMFHRQQESLKQAAAAEQNPERRKLIELRREIEGHDYMTITSDRLAGISRAITMGDNEGARRDDAMAKDHARLAGEKRQERTELQREMRQREADRRAQTERGGLGSAAQPGAVAERGYQHRRSTAEVARARAAGDEPQTGRARSPAERAMQRAAGRHAAPTREEDRDQAARMAQQEQDKQREGLRPDQPIETAPSTKEARQIEASERAARSSSREVSEERRQGRQRLLGGFSREASEDRQQDREQGRGLPGRERTRGE